MHKFSFIILSFVQGKKKKKKPEQNKTKQECKIADHNLNHV